MGGGAKNSFLGHGPQFLYIHQIFNTWIKLVMWPQCPAPWPLQAAALGPYPVLAAALDPLASPSRSALPSQNCLKFLT